MQRTTRLVTTLAAGVATVALGAGPATADSQAHRDPRGDVVASDVGRLAPSTDGIDIVRVKNRYEGRTLSLATRVVDRRDEDYGMVWLIRAGDESWQLAWDVTGRRPRLTLSGAPGAEDCSNLGVFLVGNVVEGYVPRSCLDGADAVRVASLTFDERGPAGYRSDDGRQTGRDEPSGPHYGPVLRRS